MYANPDCYAGAHVHAMGGYGHPANMNVQATARTINQTITRLRTRRTGMATQRT